MYIFSYTHTMESIIFHAMWIMCQSYNNIEYINQTSYHIIVLIKPKCIVSIIIKNYQMETIPFIILSIHI